MACGAAPTIQCKCPFLLSTRGEREANVRINSFVLFFLQTQQHGELAHAIDDFCSECGADWGHHNVEDELFLLAAAEDRADGRDSDKDEEKDKDVKGAEEEGEGVREVREALASTSMVDEDMMDWA